MFIETVTLPPAVCEMRQDFNDPVTAPCRVLVDINRGYSTVLFNIDGFIITITGNNMPGGRIDAESIKVSDAPRAKSSGECEIRSHTMRVSCNFKVGDSQFHIEGRF